MIKSKPHILFLIVPLLSLSLTIQSDLLAQSDSENILSAFKTYRDKYYPEKIFLRSDRNLYLTGETVWFKIYCTDGAFHKPSGLSKVVYVELIKDSAESLIHAVIPLQNGKGSGFFYLPTTLTSGNYILRAYTKWMRNLDEAFFFHRTIAIINPFKRLGLSKSKTKGKYKVNFFPEGGSLIAGQKSKVAFQGTDQNGNSISFRGWLTDNEGDTIQKFSPLHAGIGSFFFTPESGKSYTAHISGPDNLHYDFEISRILQKGLTLYVESDDENIHIKVSSHPGDNSKVKLFIHSRGIIEAFAKLDLHDGNTSFTINKSKLEPGITHITLFNAAGHPSCERLVFIRPKKLLKITVTPEQKSYTTREQVKLNIQTAVSGNTIASDLSVSVFKYDDHYPDTGNNIVSYLFMKSDLKGRIENPEYYMTGDQGSEKAVDNLMLTQGWRRFEWRSVFRSDTDINLEIPEYRHMIVTGTLKKKSSGEPVRDTLVYLCSPGKFLQTYVSQSDSSGRIYFELKKFFGNRQVVLQTQYKPEGGYDLKIDQVFSFQPLTTQAQPLQINRDWEIFIKKLSVSMQIRNAYRETSPNVSPVLPDTSLFYGQPDERYYLDDFTRFPVMEEVMREYVHGVLVRRRKNHFYFKVIDPENDKVFSKSPMILLDGVPVFQTDRIMEYDPKKIERIDVLTRKYIIGKNTPHGIVSFNTYAGNLNGFDISDADMVMFIDGLQAKRSFYSPAYDKPKDLESRIPDYRNLLYWKPDLSTDASGSSPVHFFSSDEPGTYKIVVEGITPEGIPGYGETFIEIKQGQR